MLAKTLVYKGRGRTFARFIRDGREISSCALPRRLLAVAAKLDERALDGVSEKGDLGAAMGEWLPFIERLAAKVAEAKIDCVFVDEKAPSGYNKTHPENSWMFAHVFRHHAWIAFGRELERASGEAGGRFSRALMVRVRSEKAQFSYDGRSNAAKTPWREELVFQEKEQQGSE